MQLAFDASTVDPTQGPEAWPLADYPLEITKEETKPTKDDPNSSFLELTLMATDGPYKGKTHPYRLNLWNANQEAVRIAYQHLSALCHAIGRIQIHDTSHLLGGRFIGTIGPQKTNASYSEIKRVKDAQGNEPGKAAAAMAAAAPAPVYAQPGPAPTAAAPAQPAGGWQQPTAAAAPTQAAWSAPAPAAAPAPPPPPPAPVADPSASWQRSPDGGAWKLNPATNVWEPAGAPPAPAAPAAAWQAPPAGPTQAAAPVAQAAPAAWTPNADPNAQPAAPWGKPAA